MVAKTPTRRPRQRGQPDVDALLKGVNGGPKPAAAKPNVSRETKAEPQDGVALNAISHPDRMQREDPRGDPRPEMRADSSRDETSRDRAERRAAEIMGHLEGALDEGPDELSLDGIAVPDGWSYEWKRSTVYGKSDPSYDSRLARTGWETVPADRHPAMMPKGHRGPIEREGLILMERPKAITDRVKQIMYRRARDAVKLKERQLNEGPEGTFARVDQSGQPTARVRTTYSPVEIPVPDV
jgi:hypothetical protein